MNRRSRKRLPETKEEDFGRPKIPRHVRPVDQVVSSNDEEGGGGCHLVTRGEQDTNCCPVSTTFSTSPDEDDHSSSLETMITELMLFETARPDFDDAVDSIVETGFAASVAAATADVLDDELPPSDVVTVQPNDRFDGLVICRTAAAEAGNLSSDLELDPIDLHYPDEECESPLCRILEGHDQQNIQNFEVPVQTETEKTTPTVSSSSSSSPLPPHCQTGEFVRQTRWWSEGNAGSRQSYGRVCCTDDDRGETVLNDDLQVRLQRQSRDCQSRPNVGKEFVFDHNYCQNLCTLRGAGLDLTCDERNGCDVKETIFSRDMVSCSALKSLLLDSNLTEDVRKEVELDRARRREHMSKKLRATSDSHLQRLGNRHQCGKNTATLENNNYYSVTGEGAFRFNEDFEREERNSDLKCIFGDEKLLSVTRSQDRISYRLGFGPFPSSSGAAAAAAAAGTGGSDSGIDASASPTGLELSANNDGEDVFFDSFDEFYSNNLVGGFDLLPDYQCEYTFLM